MLLHILQTIVPLVSLIHAFVVLILLIVKNVIVKEFHLTIFYKFYLLYLTLRSLPYLVFVACHIVLSSEETLAFVVFITSLTLRQIYHTLLITHLLIIVDQVLNAKVVT